MDRVRARDFGGGDDARNLQVAVACRWRTDAHIVIRKPDMQRLPIGLTVDRDGLDAHLLAARMIRSAISPRLAIRIFF